MANQVNQQEVSFPKIHMGGVGQPVSPNFPYWDEGASAVSMAKQDDWGLACLMGWAKTGYHRVTEEHGRQAAQEWRKRYEIGHFNATNRKRWAWDAERSARQFGA